MKKLNAKTDGGTTDNVLAEINEQVIDWMASLSKDCQMDLCMRRAD